MKKYKQHVNNTLSSLLSSPVNFWGTDTFNVFFEDGKLAQLKIKSIMPELSAVDEANLSKHITTTVEQYFTLSLWEKIWWRLTKPINHYMMLHDILTLKEMKEAFVEDSVSKSIVIYNQSSFSKHLDFWDGLMTSWRYLLDNLILTKSTRYKESLIRDSLIYMKEPFNSIELIYKVNQYVELMDKKFNELAPYYIYTKENAIKILQNENNVCEKILDKVSLANNQCIGIDVEQCVKEVTKVKEQVEYRLNTLSMEYSSLKEMVNELLAQDYLTPGERDCLNVSKETIREKEQQAASTNVYFDNMIKQVEKMNNEQKIFSNELAQSSKELDQNILRIQDIYDKQEQSFDQLKENSSRREQSFDQLKENISRREQSFSQLKENSSRREQSLKQLEENISRRDQSMKEFSQDLKRQNNEFRTELTDLIGEVGQFFSQRTHADNGLLLEQTEEENSDEQISFFDSKMP